MRAAAILSKRPQTRYRGNLTSDKSTPTFPPNGRLPVPSACQNRAETRGIEQYPSDERTGSDQEHSTWPLAGRTSF